MPCRVTGRRHLVSVVTITTQSRSRCRACSKRSMRSFYVQGDNHGSRRDVTEPDQRLEVALAAFVRQEFGAPIATIIGLTELLIEDARSGGDDVLASVFDRLHAAGCLLRK